MQKSWILIKCWLNHLIAIKTNDANNCSTVNTFTFIRNQDKNNFVFSAHFFVGTIMWLKCFLYWFCLRKKSNPNFNFVFSVNNIVVYLMDYVSCYSFGSLNEFSITQPGRQQCLRSDQYCCIENCLQKISLTRNCNRCVTSLV